MIDNRLFLAGAFKLHVHEVTTSLTEPLTPLTVINTKEIVLKILRVGNQLLLGQRNGYLEVVDINNCNITSTH
jgi:hypothetical protein